MKKFFSWILIACITFIAGRAFALETVTQNVYTTAESLDAGMTQTGVFVTAGNNFVSYYPGFRYGLAPLLEVGAKVGAVTVNVSAPFSLGKTSKVAALAGADLKYQIIKQTDDIPVDMAVDLGYNVTFISGIGVNELTFATIVSRAIPLTDSGYKLTPYGGLQLSALYNSSIYIHSGSNTTNYYLFGGLEWKLTQKFMVTAELKAGSTALGGIGIKFEY